MGLPQWLSSKKIHLQCVKPGFDPWVGKIPWKRERLPTPVFWSGEFRGLYSSWGHKESYTTERLLHRYTYVPFLLNLPPTSHPIPPLQVVTEHQYELPASYSKSPLALYFVYENVCFSVTLSVHPILSFPHCVHKSVPYVCTSTAKDTENMCISQRYLAEKKICTQ